MEKRVYVVVMPDQQGRLNIGDVDIDNLTLDRQSVTEEVLSKSGKKLVSPKKLAELFDVTRQTVHNWRRLGLIDAFTLGGKIYYDADEIMDNMRKRSGHHSC